MAQLSAVINGAAMGYGNFIDLWFVNDSDRQAAANQVPITFYDDMGNGYTISSPLPMQIGPYGGNYNYGLSYNAPNYAPAGMGTPLTTAGGGGGGGGASIAGLQYAFVSTDMGTLYTYFSDQAAAGAAYSQLNAPNSWTYTGNAGAGGNNFHVTSQSFTVSGGSTQSSNGPPWATYMIQTPVSGVTSWMSDGSPMVSPVYYGGTAPTISSGGGGGGGGTITTIVKVQPTGNYYTGNADLSLNFATAEEATAVNSVLSSLYNSGLMNRIIITDGTNRYQNNGNFDGCNLNGSTQVTLYCFSGWYQQYTSAPAAIILSWTTSGYAINVNAGIQNYSINFGSNSATMNFDQPYASSFSTAFATHRPYQMDMLQPYNQYYTGTPISSITTSGSYGLTFNGTWTNNGSSPSTFDQMTVTMGWASTSGGGGSTPTITYTNSRIDTDGTVFKDVASASINGNKIVAVGTNGKIRWTGDTGNTWNTATVSPSTIEDFISVTTTWDTSTQQEGFTAITNINGLAYSSNDAINWSRVDGLFERRGTTVAKGTTSSSVAGRSYGSNYIIAYGENKKSVYYNTGHTGGFTSNAGVAGTGTVYSYRALDSTWNSTYGTKTAVVGDGGSFAWTSSTNPTSISDWNQNSALLPAYDFNGIKLSLRSSSTNQPSIWVKTNTTYSTVLYSENLADTSQAWDIGANDYYLNLCKEYTDGNYANTVYTGGQYNHLKKWNYNDPQVQTYEHKSADTFHYAGNFLGELYPINWACVGNGFIRGNTYGIISESNVQNPSATAILNTYNGSQRMLGSFKVPTTNNTIPKYYILTDKGLGRCLGTDGPFEAVVGGEISLPYTPGNYSWQSGYGTPANRLLNIRRTSSVYANISSSSAYNVNGFIMNDDTGATMRNFSYNISVQNIYANSQIKITGSYPVTKIVKGPEYTSGKSKYAYLTPDIAGYWNTMIDYNHVGFYTNYLFGRPSGKTNDDSFKSKDIAASANANVFFSVQGTQPTSYYGTIYKMDVTNSMATNYGNPTVTSYPLYSMIYPRSIYYNSTTDKMIIVGDTGSGTSNVMISSGNSVSTTWTANSTDALANTMFVGYANTLTNLNGTYYMSGYGFLAKSTNLINWTPIHRTETSQYDSGESRLDYKNGYYYRTTAIGTASNSHINISQSVFGLKPYSPSFNGSPVNVSQTYGFNTMRPKLTWSPSHNCWVMFVKNSILTSNNLTSWNRKNFVFANSNDINFYYNTKLITSNNALLYVQTAPGRYFTTYRSNT